MISTVILSKDKPAQLRLLLDSLQINGGNLFDITVIYEYSDDLCKNTKLFLQQTCIQCKLPDKVEDEKAS